MANTTASRLRELLEQLKRAQHETGDVAEQARHELAGLINGRALKPASAPDSSRKKKAGRKKR